MAQPYDRKFNFSAGPGAIPVPVLEQIRDEMVNHRGDGMSVMEMSHRGKAYLKIAEESEANVRSFLGVPQDYKVLFLQGGASTQFTMLAMNFLKGGHADYVCTGAWGKKGIDAAKYEGEVNVLWDGKAGNYSEAPEWDTLPFTSGSRYTHFTMNETIQGVDFGFDPATGGDLVCDMSSCIGSRPFDMSAYAVVYAGAQKNLGPSGATLVAIRPDMLERCASNVPPMLDYKVQIEGEWMYNTPPCFAVYVCGLVCKHWNDFGGLEAVGKMNTEKANLLYKAIDSSSGFYTGHARPDCRSQMNVPFTLKNEDLTTLFLQEAGKNGFLELKGHRSVGGCRASLYNAVPLDWVQALTSFMTDFADKNR